MSVIAADGRVAGGVRALRVAVPTNGAEWDDAPPPTDEDAPADPQANGRGRGAQSTPSKAPELICMATIKPTPVSFLWGGRIPRGKVSIIEGDPGEGKGTLSVDIAARISTGEPIYGDEGSCEPEDVILISGEDALDDTVRPRLAAAGADCNRVHAIGLEDAARLRLDAQGIAWIAEWLARTKAGLCVLDPLMAFMPTATDSHKDSDVRVILSRLSSLADKSGAAIVLVRHLNKGDGRKALYRGGGSIGIVGAARSVLLVVQDREDPEARVLVPVKCNLCRKPPALRFRLVSCGAVARIEWLGETEINADEAVEAERPRERQGKSERAADYIRGLLAGGPRPRLEVRGLVMKATGISERSLDRVTPGLVTRLAGDTWALTTSLAVLASGGFGGNGGNGAPGTPKTPETPKPPTANSESDGAPSEVAS